MSKILYEGEADIRLMFVYGSMELPRAEVVVEEGIPGIYARLLTSTILPGGALELVVRAGDGQQFSGVITYQEREVIKFSLLDLNFGVESRASRLRTRRS